MTSPELSGNGERDVGVLLAELRSGWDSGARPRVEDVLRRHPDYTPGDEDLLDLIDLEAHLRTQAGDRPTQAELAGRFPRVAAELPILLGVNELFDGSDLDADGSPLPPPGLSLPANSRYADATLIARGGVGAVWRVREGRLRRDLAVKALLPKFRENPVARRRLRREARITAGLQHPAVPPVHDTGVLADGSPFFVMKLVEGQTLAELLSGRSGPEDRLDAFLDHFEQVVFACAAAHERGIVHRDLKPHNVMVGAFGEVQTMDWGFAREAGPPLSDAEDEPSGTVDDPADADTLDAALTRGGTAIGTPAYMPPEQARGDAEAVGPPSDVFGLGAILCEILTGHPPYGGTDAAAAAEAAAAADLGDARRRLDASSVDAPLVQICGDCLQPRPQDRPPHAGELATRLAAYRQSVRQRLQDEEVRRAAAEVKAAEERKRRRVLLGATALGGLLLATLGAAAWWVHQDRAADRAAAASRVDRQLAAATALRDVAVSVQPQSLAAFRELEADWSRIGSTIDGIGGADVALAADRFLADEVLALADEARDAAARVAADRRMIEQLDAAFRLREDIRDGNYLGGRRGVIVYGSGGPAAYEAAFREYGVDITAVEPDAAAARLKDSAIRDRLAAALTDWLVLAPESDAASNLRRVADALDPNPARVRIRRAIEDSDYGGLADLADAIDANDTVSTVLPVADALQMSGNADASIDLLQRAVLNRPGVFEYENLLGSLLAVFEPTRRAETLARLGAAHALRPGRAFTYASLASVYAGLGQSRAAAALQDAGLAKFPEDVRLQIGAAESLLLSGDFEGTEAKLRRLLADNPRSNQVRQQLALVLSILRKDQEARKLLKDVIAAAPDDPDANLMLAMTSAFEGKLDEFAATTERIRQRFPGLTAADEQEAQVQAMTGNADAAIQTMRDALRRTGGTATGLLQTGLLLDAAGQGKEAVGYLRAAIALNPSTTMPSLELGRILEELGRDGEAQVAYVDTLCLHLGDGPAREALKNVLAKTGRFAEAEAALSPFISRLPDEDRADWDAYWRAVLATEDDSSPNSAPRDASDSQDPGVPDPSRSDDREPPL